MSREAAAIKIIADKGGMLQGELFALFGAIAGARIGNAFEIEKFARNVGNLEKNIVAADAQLTLAATTTFADGEWVYTCPADRFRMILNFGIIVSNGANNVTRGVVNQLNQTGALRIQRNTGKAQNMPFRAFNLGANPARVEVVSDTNSTAGTAKVYTNSWNAQDSRILEAELAPEGIRQAMIHSIDVLGPNDRLVKAFTGLNGATLANSQSGLVGASYALVIDAIMSGR